MEWTLDVIDISRELDKELKGDTAWNLDKWEKIMTKAAKSTLVVFLAV